MVLLEPEGQRFLKAETAGKRKAIWRERLLKLRLFSELAGVVQRQGDEGVESSFVMETLALSLPDENLERTFDTIIEWGRFGGLFEYDEARELLTPPE